MDQKQIRKLIQVVGSLISVGLFVWLLSNQDWLLVFQILKQIPVWVIPVSFFLIFSGLLVNTWRWWMLVRSQQIDISFINTLKLVMAGSYASNFLPSTIGGDLVRVIGMLNYHRSKVVVVSSVVVDRAINVISFLALTPLALWTFDIKSFFSGSLHHYSMSLGIANLKWMQGFKEQWSTIKNSLRTSFELWSRSPQVIAKAFGISWLSLIVVFLGVWVLAWGIRIQVSLLDVISVSVVVYLLTLLPISVNGYGLREVAVIALYTQLGASIEQASTLAIITRSLALISTLPGAFWLHRDVILESLDESMDSE